MQARAELWIKEWHLSPSQSRDLYLACADLLRTVSKVQSLPRMLSRSLEGPCVLAASLLRRCRHGRLHAATVQPPCILLC